MSAYENQDKTADEWNSELSEAICLLHLVAMGELDTQATVKDAVKWFWKVNEDCTKCQYNQNCLCCLYTNIQN